MSWFFLSLLSAVSFATADALTKRYYSDLSPYEMGLTRLTYTLPWLFGAVFFVPPAHPDRVFFICLACGLPLEALAFYCYMKAIKISPLSLSLPFLAFTPLFIILTGRLILGERLSAPGIIGIILIVIGSYFLNLSRIKTGIFEPVQAIFREPGSWLMLLAAFIYSLTATIGKVGIQHSNPYFFGIFYFVAFAFMMMACVPFVPDVTPRTLITKPIAGFLLGAAMALMIFSHTLAISMVEAAYMISIKRSSLIFGVLFGALWFREEKIAERLTGALIMISGVFLIGFFG